MKYSSYQETESYISLFLFSVSIIDFLRTQIHTLQLQGNAGFCHLLTNHWPLGLISTYTRASLNNKIRQ